MVQNKIPQHTRSDDYSPEDFIPFVRGLRRKGYEAVGLGCIYSGSVLLASISLRKALEVEGISCIEFRMQKQSAWEASSKHYREVLGYWSSDDITYLERILEEYGREEYEKQRKERLGSVDKIDGLENRPLLLVDGDIHTGQTILGALKSLLENHDTLRFSELYVVVGRDSFLGKKGLAHYAVTRHGRVVTNGYRGDPMHLVEMLYYMLSPEEFEGLHREGKLELINGVTKRKLGRRLRAVKN